MIFSHFAKGHKCGFIGQEIRIIPILDENKCFDFTYEVIGFKCVKVNRVFIKTVAGASSFTDFLVFIKKNCLKKALSLFMPLRKPRLTTRRAVTPAFISAALNLSFFVISIPMQN